LVSHGFEHYVDFECGNQSAYVLCCKQVVRDFLNKRVARYHEISTRPFHSPGMLDRSHLHQRYKVVLHFWYSPICI
uniref:TRM13 domain-containing protein n=1 Tax=Angiostrongylus cantonensis TaxID=6313 RepID=A0A0K0D7B9_ANGCA